MSYSMCTQVGQRNHVLDGGAHWHHLANTTEPSMCGADAALLSNYSDHLLCLSSQSQRPTFLKPATDLPGARSRFSQCSRRRTSGTGCDDTENTRRHARSRHAAQTTGWRGSVMEPSTARHLYDVPHQQSLNTYLYMYHCLTAVFQVNLPSVLWHCGFGIRKSTRPVKNWVMRWWHGYLSEAKCKWFAYGPADATATPSSLASLKSRLV